MSAKLKSFGCFLCIYMTNEWKTEDRLQLCQSFAQTTINWSTNHDCMQSHKPDRSACQGVSRHWKQQMNAKWNNNRNNNNNNNNNINMLHGSRWTRPWGPWWVDDFSCKVTLTQWIRNQVTGSGFIRWLQPSWQTARWAGRTNGHWFFNKGPEAVSQPGYGDIFSRGDGLLPMMAWLAPDHRPPHRLCLPPHTFPWLCPVSHTGLYLSYWSAATAIQLNLGLRHGIKMLD